MKKKAQLILILYIYHKMVDGHEEVHTFLVNGNDGPMGSEISAEHQVQDNSKTTLPVLKDQYAPLKYIWKYRADNDTVLNILKKHTDSFVEAYNSAKETRSKKDIVKITFHMSDATSYFKKMSFKEFQSHKEFLDIMKPFIPKEVDLSFWFKDEKGAK